MDRLDQLLDAAAPLLNRVDEVLATIGAPEGHDVWAELRRVRLLPGDAARAVAALHPASILDAVPELRADARAYADLADALPPAGSWSGEAAEAYEAARRRAAEHLNGGPDSLGSRMEATADLADDLTDWMIRTRDDLAVTLAEASLSTEAITLTGGDHPPDTQATAAATLGAVLLRTIADSYDRAEGLLDGSTALQTPLLV
ncbi:hypothetical protein FHR83_007498 [Actinoplanes campanulatus]|uniref:Uncharacterized protein n=1 Tax=Actinoplanes campanulatus TaxID=113559 RepID=A0A7W5ANZ6_9ACTN|nr:hypothetical protein [Actinoplanes campanulatus]MBB3099782.1 hypothetical protein [Actinoplanes campanulatus]GGN47098.1 hypothetical protein GCM10010109_83000 [Actinoplanes campanulatus]GID40342.1 hypothetical protein Aca09nite_68480 [Actinoplanes campanulatus]